MEEAKESRKLLEDKLAKHFQSFMPYEINANLSNYYIENYLLNEPNELMGIEETTGLEWHILRHPDFYHFGGYVAIPYEFQKLFVSEDALDDIIEIHGGVTYLRKNKSIDNKFCIGFYCGHDGDLTPYSFARVKDEVYRDISYVKEQCISLAKQVHELIRRSVEEPEIFISDPKELRKIIKSLREKK